MQDWVLLGEDESVLREMFSGALASLADFCNQGSARQIGRYELDVNSPGFQPYKRIGVVIDVQIGQNTQTVEVSDTAVTIQMSDTEIGDTISSQHLAEAPLNGRSYTGLLATQAGVSPATTSGASNSSSGGGFGTVPVAGVMLFSANE